MWLTPFSLVAGMTSAAVLMNLRNIAGNWQGKPCYQTATVSEDQPDSPTVFSSGSYESSADFHNYRETLAITDKLLIRFGVAYRNSSGSALGDALVGLSAAVKQCGKALGGGNAVINPGMLTSTDVNYFVLTGWSPAVGLDKVMAAFTVTDNLSDYLEYQLVLRSAKDPRSPNGWQTAESAWTNPSTSNTLRNTGELSVPAGASITSNMWFQLGLAARKKAGAGGNPRASLTALVVGRYA